MTPEDGDFVYRALKAGQISEPILELGVGYGGSTCREMFRREKLTYYGTDVTEGDFVDFTADFGQKEHLEVFSKVAPFGSLLILNVLEHTFDPIRNTR